MAAGVEVGTAQKGTGPPQLSHKDGLGGTGLGEEPWTELRTGLCLVL